MSYKRKTWHEKLHDAKGLPKIETIKTSEKYSSRWGYKAGDTFVIPAPIEVDEIMRKVPKGKLTTINEIRKKLAIKHKTTFTCPITTGIFARIAGEASAENCKPSDTKANPYWRTLKEGGVINEKYPGGVEAQKLLLEKEGHKVVQKGKKWAVEGWENVRKN